MNNSKKITWKQILHAIIQAAIAARSPPWA
ncbi:smalltalk protein [Phocaeicola vulgatus]|nr:smalltalk protein [Phocaeicola vulgatus]